MAVECRAHLVELGLGGDALVRLLERQRDPAPLQVDVDVGLAPQAADLAAAGQQPVDQPGVEGRPIRNMLGGAEFCVVAAHTTLPVLGVPIDSSALKGLDALLATVERPEEIVAITIKGKKGDTVVVLDIPLLTDAVAIAAAPAPASPASSRRYSRSASRHRSRYESAR